MRISISNKGRYEWSCKEEGSWEDAGRPKSGHVYNLLTRTKTGIRIDNEEEMSILHKSATYNGSGSWDSGEPEIERMMKACDRIAMLEFKK